MLIYNTLTKTKEQLIPRQDPVKSPSGDHGAGKKIQMFVCGPTVYDYIHIGNARTFVFFDVVAKYLRSQGYEVDYIQNITDIDDKIIARAKENNRDPFDWAKEYTRKFKEDMEGMGVNSPKYAPATEYIEQVVKQVKTLINKGHAYLIEGDGYYFDLSTFKDYGKLSGRKAQMADDAVSRIDENDKKRNKGDFALWKFPKVRPQISKEVEPQKMMNVDGEPAWNTELGWGRPGWHIEDTAITEHYFGPQYDIHGGGQDLIFPHHEAEIAQQESASGKKPFVKYWMHVAFLIIPVKSQSDPEKDRGPSGLYGHGASKTQKMSKSLGNFETVNELLKKYPKEVLRFYLLSGYYRQPLEFSDKMLKQSQAGVDRIKELLDKLGLIEEEKETKLTVQTFKEKLNNALADDFNTPQALAAIFELIKNINSNLASNSIGKNEAKEIKNFLEYADSILDIIPTETQKIPTEVQELVEKREKLREEKDYEESDKVRREIERLGFKIEDTAYGPLVSNI